MQRLLTFILIVFILITFTNYNYAQEDWYWQHPSPQSNTLNAVSFLDENNGIAVGNYGAIIQTSNGGTTWISRNSGRATALSGVSFADENNAVAVGYNGLILKSSDGGET